MFFNSYKRISIEFERGTLPVSLGYVGKFTFWSRGQVQDYGELPMSRSTGPAHFMHHNFGVRLEILQRVQLSDKWQIMALEGTQFSG